MSEQLKQEVDTAEIDRLETETDVDSKTIGQDETELLESKLEDESGNEVKAEDTVYLGKASLAEILTGMADPTEEGCSIFDQVCGDHRIPAGQV